MRLLALIVRVLGVALLVAGPGSSAIEDCTGPSGFKVFLDEPAIAGSDLADAAQLEFFLNELLFLFDDRKEREWVEWLPEGDSGAVRFVLCRDRTPSGDGTDFDRALTDLLYNQDVLVELFAHLRGGGGAGAGSRGVALLGFVVVPLRQLHFEDSVAPEGLFKSRLETEGDADGFLDLFAGVREIDAYVAAALGLKAARQGDYEAAQRGLCQGLVTLDPSGAPALAGLLRDLAARNLDEAQRDADYQGPLELLDRSRPCPEAGP